MLSTNIWSTFFSRAPSPDACARPSAVKAAMSAARLGTYETATKVAGDEDPAALNLYAWNAQVSGALMAPLHICEVAIRNAVSDALEAIYGPQWPWSTVFEQSLPVSGRYKPRLDLINARANVTTTGKVIPELKFVFWQKMFTSRYTVRIWNNHLMRVLPNLDATQPIPQLLQTVYAELEEIRKLRNRIAHHEPIFTRNLMDDFQRITTLIGFKCKTTAGWMSNNQQALNFIQAMPQSGTALAALAAPAPVPVAATP